MNYLSLFDDLLVPRMEPAALWRDSAFSHPLGEFRGEGRFLGLRCGDFQVCPFPVKMSPVDQL